MRTAPSRRAASFFLLSLAGALASALPAEAVFRLSDPGSSIYYRFAGAAGRRIEVGQGSEITGNLHANDRVRLANGSTVHGDVSAVGQIQNQGTVTGSVRPGAPAITLPRLESEAVLRTWADRILPNNTTFTNAEINDVVFVNGDVTIAGTLSGNGTIIAKKNIQFDKFNDGQRPPLPAGRISLIALGDIRFDKNRAFRGAVYAKNNVDVQKNFLFEGVLIAGRDLTIAEDSGVTFTNVDTTAPSLAITAPPDVVVGDTQPQIAVAYSDATSGVDPASLVVTLDGGALACVTSTSGATCSPASPLSAGSHSIAASVRDRAGNPATAAKSFELRLDENAPPAAPNVDPPASPTRATSVHLTGTAAPGARIEAVGDLGSSTTTANGSGAFALDVALHPNAVNRILVTAFVADVPSAPTPVSVVQDAEAPLVFVDVPLDGARVAQDSITVVGRVSDMLSGFLGLGVTVNGEPATVVVGVGTNGTYERRDVPLAVGMNTLTVVATDALGNSATRTLTVERFVPTGARFAAISGDGQRGVVGTNLAQPIEVAIVAADGSPLPDRLVSFEVEHSDGRLRALPPVAGANPAMTVQVLSDALGKARVSWTLGSDAGCANNRLRVSAAGVEGTVPFSASADPAGARQINIGAGNQQVGETGSLAPDRLRVWVSDSRNEAAGIPVTFRILAGGGKVDGQSLITVATDTTGHADVGFAFGAAEGEQLVEATFPGNLGSPVVFVETGMLRRAGAPTTFSATVTDNAERPIGGATCEVTVAGVVQPFVRTDDDGRCAFTDLPSGAGHLHVDGATADRLAGEPVDPGTFPTLGYRLVIVPNADNRLPTPVRLPPLDGANTRFYDGTQDVVLEVAGLEGLRMTIKAGSMRRADGSVPSPSDPATLSLNQVHLDDVPMPLPDGASPLFAWTLQPSGAHFDPPIEISMPNLNGLPAGAVMYFLSFNHASERFEIIATGHVTTDGLSMETDPGSGIAVAGWGGFCPPYPNTGNANNNPFDMAKQKLRDDYEAKRNTAAAGLSHQLKCLGDRACGSNGQRAPWADEFVAKVIQDIANNRANNPSPADRVCSKIPGWLGRNISATPPLPFPPIRATVNDVCALAGGAYHFKDELFPGFKMHMKEQIDEHMARGETSAQAKQSVIDDHEGLISVIPGCFQEVNEISPLARDIAGAVVPPSARATRGSILDKICRGAALRTPLTALAIGATVDELFSTELANAGALRVRAPGDAFAIPIGSTVQLKVTDTQGNDRTTAASGALYFVATADDVNVTVSPDGLMSVHGTPSPFAASPAVVHVWAGNDNGDLTGVGQFALIDADADGDGVGDAYEPTIGLTPGTDDNEVDSDGDGLDNVSEAFGRTDPANADSDGDGVSDGAEEEQGSNPLFAGESEPVLGAGSFVSVGGQGASVLFDGTFSIRNIPATQSLVRVYGTGKRGIPVFSRSEFFQVQNQQTYSLAMPVPGFRQRPPATVAIAAAADQPVLSGLGGTTQLRASARLSDGADLDVTARAQGTTYTSSNSAIASIDSAGVVTAVGPGVAFLTAVNEGTTSSTSIVVSPGDPLTRVVGRATLPDGSAAPGATAAVVGQPISRLTAADGGFDLPGVATLLAPRLTISGYLRVTARGPFLAGVIPDVLPVGGGTTDVGILALAPPRRVDSDGDGVLDDLELLLGLDPTRSDTDGDGILDGREDADFDGLPNWAEFVVGSNPAQADSDSDGIRDDQEDADGDGLANGEEALPGADGLLTDPLNADTDGDGMSDGYESRFHLDPLDPRDAALDPDGDGLTNLEESALGSDPHNPDVVPPMVAAVAPADGTTGVPLNSRIVVRFSEPLEPAAAQSGAVRLFDGADELAGELQLSDDALSLTFKLAPPPVPTLATRAVITPAELDPSTLYTVRVEGARDLAFNPMASAFTSQFTTGAARDTTAPTALLTHPATGQSAVPINTVVRVEWSERMDPATFTSSSFRLRDNVTFLDVPAVIQLSADGRTSSLMPEQPLPAGRAFIAFLSLFDLRDAAGNSATGTSNFSFTTSFVGDSQAPRLVAASPPDGTSGIGVNAPIVLGFDEPIDAATWSRGILVTRGGAAVPGSFSAVDGNRRITFLATPSLPANATIDVAVTADLRDLVGLALANPTTLRFDTGAAADTTRPSIATVDPANGATGVATDAPVRVGFSERVSPTGVNAASFRLLHSATFAQISATVTLAPDGRSATLMPSSPLSGGTNYRVDLTTSEITDLAGQTLIPFASTFTTAAGGDSTAPTVVALSPASGAVNVPVNARLAALVSEPVAALSVGTGALTLNGPGGPVAGTIALSADRRTLNFTPAAPLSPSTLYTASASGFADRSGNLVVPTSWSFTTLASATADATRPSVATISPANAATGVPVATSIVWTFNEAVDPSTVNVDTMPVAIDNFNGQVAGSYAVSGAVVTFVPTAPLPGSVRVRPRVNFDQVKDLAGNGANSFSSQFDTAAMADTTPPVVQLVTPGNGATDVGANSVVVLTFSEPLDSATLVPANFDLFANGDKLGASVTRSSDNRTVTLTAGLPANTTVTVVATGDVRDLSGNRLAEFTSAFSTAPSFDAARPSVVSQRPGNGAFGLAPGTSVVLFANEPLDPITVPNALRVTANGAVVSGTLTLTGNGRVIELVPDAPFPANALVQVFLTSDAHDLRGNALNSYQGSFRVSQPLSGTRAELVTVSPSSGATAVPTNTLVQVVFDRPIDPVGIGGRVEIYLNSPFQQIPATTTLVGDRTVRAVPLAPLPEGSQFLVLIYLERLPNTTTVTFASFTTGADLDLVRPAVTALAPPDGRTNVGLNSFVRVRFDEAINPTTVTEQTVRLTAGGAPAPACTIEFSSDDKSVKIVPHAPLRPGTRYSIDVSGIEDLAGNLVQPAAATFDTGTEPDTTSPQVIGTTPLANASGVPVNTAVALVLDEPIDPSSVSLATFRVRENTNFTDLAGSTDVSADGKTLHFIPAAPFPAGRGLTVFASFQGIEDLGGNALSGGTFSFTAALQADATPPVVLGVGPRDGVSAVPRNGRVAIRFDEPISSSSAAGANLVGPSGPLAVKRTFSDGNRLLTLTPTAPLAAGTSYDAMLLGLTDLAGNSLPAFAFGFSTGGGFDLSRPLVSFNEPVNGATGVSTTIHPGLRFTERVNPATVTATTFRVLHAGTFAAVAGATSVSADGLSATFTPTLPLLGGTTYRIDATTSEITDLTGQTLQPFASTFTTAAGADSDAPTILSVSPQAGSTGVAVNARISVKVSEPVNALSVGTDAIVVSTVSGPVAGLVSLSTDRTILTWTAAAPLSPSTLYTATASGFTDRSGLGVAPATWSFTTGASTTPDATRPSVATISPANAATGVSVATAITWTFNEPIDPTGVSVDTMPVTVDGFSGSVPGSYAVTGAAVTFLPAAPLPGGARVRPRVNFDQVKDFAGNGSNAFSSQFDTTATADTTPPEVQMVTPGNGATEIGPNTTVAVTFSEPLDPSTISAGTLDLFAGGVRLNSSVTRSSDNRTVMLAATLPAASVVTVFATDDIKDLSGNRLANFSSAFSTAAAFDASRPSVVAQRPGNGAAGAPVDTSVILFANESLDRASVPAAFAVTENGVVVAGTLAFSAADRTIEFVPTQPYAPGALIQVFLTPDARDLSGNAMNNYQGSFRVEAVPSGTFPNLVRSSPSSGQTEVPTNPAIDLEFDRAIDPATLNGRLDLRPSGGGASVAGTYTLRGGGKIVRFLPSVELMPNRSYFGVVTLDSSNSTFTFINFTTASGSDGAAPRVVSLSPPDGQTAVGVNAHVRVRFDERVNPTTVTGSTVLLTDGSVPAVPCSIEFSSDNSQVKIVPHAPLRAGVGYLLRVDGVEDLAGHPVLPVSAAFAAGTQPDTTAPVAIDTNPPGSAVGVPVGTVISVAISEPVDPASVTGSTFFVRDNTTFQNLPATVGTSGDGRRLTLVPAAPFAPNRSHTIFLVNQGIEDLAGNRLASGNFSFTTAAGGDATAPNVVEIGPRDGWLDVPTNGRVLVRFDEPISSLSTASASISSAGGLVAVGRGFADGNRLFGLFPQNPLGPATQYTLSLAGITDLAGNPLAPTTTTFTTEAGADLIRPTVATVSPTNSATGVSRSTTVTVTFSERISPATISASTFRLLLSSTFAVVPSTFVVAADGRSATLTPLATLAANTSYRVDLTTSEISDLTQQTLTPFASTFTTGP